MFGLLFTFSMTFVLIVSSIAYIHQDDPSIEDRLTSPPLNTKHQALMKKAEGSIQQIKNQLAPKIIVPTIDFHLVETVQDLQKQVAALSVSITSVVDKLISVSEAALRALTSISKATNITKRHLDVLWHRQNTLAKALEQRKENQNLAQFTSLTSDCCKAATSALSKRVLALERNASQTDGALMNVSKLIGLGFEHLKAELAKTAANQKRLVKSVGKALGDERKALSALQKMMARKQNRLVVEVGSKILKHKVLESTVRLDFKRNFTKTPQVFVGLSGFAMDPDHATFDSDKKSTKIHSSSSLDSLVYKVQTNFYTARIVYSGIGLTGFSIRVMDGRELRYSAYQWIQVEYLAIGE